MLNWKFNVIHHCQFQVKRRSTLFVWPFINISSVNVSFGGALIQYWIEYTNTSETSVNFKYFIRPLWNFNEFHIWLLHIKQNLLIWSINRYSPSYYQISANLTIQAHTSSDTFLKKSRMLHRIMTKLNAIPQSSFHIKHHLTLCK